MTEATQWSLRVEPLDLGPGLRAVGLTLVDEATEEPVTAGAGMVWARVLRAAAHGEPLVLDFFSHTEKVRAYCQQHDIAFQQTAGRGVAVVEEDVHRLSRLFERFRGETFGARAGAAVSAPDPELERELRRRGIDAYQPACERYLFCAICELESASITFITHQLWASEVARRLRPALSELHVRVETIL